MKKIVFMISIILLLIFQSYILCFANQHALVIGNSGYKEIPLRSPINDANDMSSILERMGFNVIKKVNVNYQEMEDAIRQFGKAIKPNDIALFYFSGHGVQVAGINYLLPIGINIDSEDEIKYKSVAADMVLDKLEHAGSRLNIIILDACRNNPFKRARTLDKGLAMMSAPTGNH